MDIPNNFDYRGEMGSKSKKAVASPPKQSAKKPPTKPDRMRLRELVSAIRSAAKNTPFAWVLQSALCVLLLAAVVLAIFEGDIVLAIGTIGIIFVVLIVLILIARFAKDLLGDGTATPHKEHLARALSLLVLITAITGTCMSIADRSSVIRRWLSSPSPTPGQVELQIVSLQVDLAGCEPSKCDAWKHHFGVNFRVDDYEEYQWSFIRPVHDSIGQDSDPLSPPNGDGRVWRVDALNLNSDSRNSRAVFNLLKSADHVRVSMTLSSSWDSLDGRTIPKSVEVPLSQITPGKETEFRLQLNEVSAPASGITARAIVVYRLIRRPAP